MPLKDLLTEALRETPPAECWRFFEKQAVHSPWISAFGGLRALHKETNKINRILQQEFDQIEVDE